MGELYAFWAEIGKTYLGASLNNTLDAKQSLTQRHTERHADASLRFPSLAGCSPPAHSSSLFSLPPSSLGLPRFLLQKA